MYGLLHDLRFGLRALRRRPLLLVTAAVTLGLGIGASTAVFSVVESALLRSLPFRDSDRLVVVWGVAGAEQDIRGASPIEIEDWDAGAAALGPLAYYDETTRNLTGGEAAEQLEAETVGPGFFSILGATPALGRALVAEDHQPGAPGSAVISHALWQRRFGGGPGVLGRALVLDDVSFTVVGVMPPGFTGLSFDTEVWTSLGPYATSERLANRGTRYLAALGRLEPGASAERAQAQLDAVAARLAEEYPDENRDRGAQLFSLRDYYLAGADALMWMVLGGVGLLLLVACANVANLQLVRAVERRREVALRYALGSSTGQVARQLVAESLVLSLLGGAVGVAMAWAGLQALLPLVPAGVLPPYARPAVDGPVLLFGLAAAVGAGLFFALAPVLRAAGEDAASSLRGGGRGIRAGRGSRTQRAIIAGEVALAVVLLVGAGFAVDSLRAQLALEPGFEPEGVLASRLTFSSEYDRDARTAFVRDITAQLEARAGVDAAVVSRAPLRGYSSASYIFRADDPMDPEHRTRFYFHGMTPRAFELLGIPIIEGRALRESDHRDAPAVAVVSDAFAAKVWPGEPALGKQLYFAGDTATVVGVAGNVRQRVLTVSLMDPGEDPDVYFAYPQLPVSSVDILARTYDGDPAALAATVRRAAAELDPSLPLYDVATLESELAAQTALGRMVSTLMATFAVLALVAAAVGLFGLLAFMVRSRRAEIAIRTALGATPVRIVGLVVRQGVGTVVAGLAVGLLGALAASGIAANQLYGVEPGDPAILAGTALVLLAVGTLASLIPAVQALRVEPRTAMAEE